MSASFRDEYQMPLGSAEPWVGLQWKAHLATRLVLTLTMTACRAAAAKCSSSTCESCGRSTAGTI